MSISVGYKREKKQLSKTKDGDKREVKQMIIVKTYRGHIRNWEELCERLGIDLTLSREEREHEILIKAYQTWGCEMADHMHGMFAFALWDEEEQKLFCLRDQFGTKPFYYYETEDGELLYGTMIRDIIDQPGFKKELNEEMLQLYLSLTYVAGENTFFRGLKKLLPGRYLIWQDGKLEIHRYWKPEFHPDESKTLEDWADEIHNTLKEIMPEVKTADERVESFLSGGVDSSYVLAMSDAEQADCCGYEEERFDELFLRRRQHSFLEENFPEVSLHRSSSLILYLMLCTIWSNHLEMHLRLYLHLDVMQQQNIRRSVIPERVLTNSSVVIICTETQNVMVRI